jgi:hypothetical protein
MVPFVLYELLFYVQAIAFHTTGITAPMIFAYDTVTWYHNRKRISTTALSQSSGRSAEPFCQITIRYDVTTLAIVKSLPKS